MEFSSAAHMAAWQVQGHKFNSRYRKKRTERDIATATHRKEYGDEQEIGKMEVAVTIGDPSLGSTCAKYCDLLVLFHSFMDKWPSDHGMG